MTDTPPAPAPFPAQPPRPGSDDWNTETRDELPFARADRNFAELLQELRVLFTGVQILFGFLLTASFTDRFTSLDTLQRTAFVATLVSAVLSSVALVAPVAAHRVLFHRGRKPELVRWGHTMALAGLGLLGATIASGLLLVMDLAVGRVAAVVAAVAVAVGIVALWLVVPLVRVGDG